MKNIDRFGLSEPQLRALIAEGMKYGANWCDLYFEDTSCSDFLLRDGEVASAGRSTDYGCGIRALKGERTGYAYSESTAFRSVLAAARAAASIAAGDGGGAVPGPSRTLPSPDRYPVRKAWCELDSDIPIAFLKEIEKGIRSREASCFKVIATLSYSESHIFMYNSLGEIAEDFRPLCSVSVQVIYIRGARSETRSVSRSRRTGAEFLGPALIEDIVSSAVRDIDRSFEAGRPRGGRMSVVMGAGASGILLHEAMGHAFEADFNRKGQSVFCDKMGSRVARPGINIIDDGTLPAGRGSLNFDDEGVPGQKTYMVTDGILTSYLHDRISAGWYGVPPTGNGRRESFRYNPIPRMRATYMENGSDGSLQDIIADVRKGIYVDQFSNGEVKIGEGDFTFYVKSGSLIENGRLTMPVKDINIIGNGPEALADIVAVAGDLRIDEGTWTCGKEQSVAVSCGIPSVLVRELTVGGE